MKLILIRSTLVLISLIVLILLLLGVIGKIDMNGRLVKFAFVLGAFNMPLIYYKNKLEQQQTNNNQKD
jgi:hypothetical protein